MRALRNTHLAYCFHAALVVLLLAAQPGFAQARKSPHPPQASSTQPTQGAGVPVLVKGKTLFHVRARLFTFSAEDRAKAITEKVVWLSKQPLSRIQAISVVDEGNITEIVSEDTVITTVTDGDAAAVGQSRQVLAKEYADKIRATAEALQKQYSMRTLLFGILYAAIATALLILILKLFGTVFPKTYFKLESWRGVYIRSVRIQKVELLPAARITSLLKAIVRIARIALSLVVLYVYLTLLLGFFPWSQGYSTILFQYILSPVRSVGGAVLAYLPNVFFVVVILLAAYYLSKFVKFIFGEIAKETIALPGFYPEWAEPTYKIARFLILAFTLVVIFPYLPGSKSPAFQGVSIFLGLLLSLGSTSAVANVVAGSVLTYTRAMKVGDRIQIGETVGDVTEKTLLVTRIRTIKNVDIAIPNAMVLNSHILNFSSAAKERGLILHTSATISYDAPWRTVHQLMIDAALSTENVLKDPKPFVLQTSLDDFYVSYQLNVFTDQPAVMAGTYSDLHQNIQDKFNEAGVEILSPHYGALRDGNQLGIPGKYVPEKYEAPSFRIRSEGFSLPGRKNDSSA
ncbi:MAG: mechanosensitive ion channel domain-containing protein [Candidatus Acidiferrum sp.]